MFSGLIEALGGVTARQAVPHGLRLTMTTPWNDVAAGESVAVNGVCLTVVEVSDRSVHVDVGPETLRVTTLGTLRPVSIECSVRRLTPMSRARSC